jgi:zinc transporter
MLPSDLDSGLICGFAAGLEGALRPIGWAELGAALAPGGSSAWLHFNAADRRAQHFIRECADIPEAARGFLLERDNRARFEPIEGGIAAALLDLRIGADDDPSETGMLRFWCTRQVLLTTRSVPLATIDELRRSIRAPHADRGALDFLVALFHLFEVTFARLTGELDAQFTRLEDAILAERFLEQGGELGRLRRRMVHLRRLVNPQQHVLHTVAVRPPGWVDRAGQEMLQDLADRLACPASAPMRQIWWVEEGSVSGSS